MDVPIIISATEAKPEMMAVLAWQVVWTQYLVVSLFFTKVSMHMDITGRVCIVFSLNQWNKHTKYNLLWMIYLCYFWWFISHVYNCSTKLGSLILSIRNFSLSDLAKLLQLKLIHIFVRAILLLKRLETEKTKSNFIISALKVKY